MTKKWVVLGICGVTNGGKTTLSRALKTLLPHVQIIAQDTYFLPQTSPKHVLIPELNHFNWELLSSLDMEQMYEDIKNILDNKNVPSQLEEDNEDLYLDIKINSLENLQLLKTAFLPYNLLVIEGFCIFNYGPIEKLCDLKFYLTLDKETCRKRRAARIYDPPDVPGYFEDVVWPEHLKQREEVQRNCKNIVYLKQSDEDHLGIILKNLLEFYNS